MTNPETEIQLKDLLDVVKLRIKQIIIVTLISFISSVFYALIQENVYQSESILKVTDTNENNISMISQFGGLASMAGINLPSSGENKADLAIEKIKSRDFFNHLVNKDSLIVPYLMAAESYDLEENKFSFDESIYNPEKGVWLKNERTSRSLEPSLLETYEVYDKQLSLSISNKNGFIYISYEHLSPPFTQHMLDLIIQEINNIFRLKELNESEESIKYLEEQLAKQISKASKRL